MGKLVAAVCNIFVISSVNNRSVVKVNAMVLRPCTFLWLLGYKQFSPKIWKFRAYKKLMEIRAGGGLWVKNQGARVSLAGWKTRAGRGKKNLASVGRGFFSWITHCFYSNCDSQYFVLTHAPQKGPKKSFKLSGFPNSSVSTVVSIYTTRHREIYATWGSLSFLSKKKIKWQRPEFKNNTSDSITVSKHRNSSHCDNSCVMTGLKTNGSQLAKV